MGEKVGAGGGVGMAEDMGEGMQCSDHPYRQNPNGVCAICLQEKLGKLVSSSKSSDPFLSNPPPPSSSCSPPSFASADLPSLSSSTYSSRNFFLSANSRRHKMKTPAAVATQSTTGALGKIAAAASSETNPKVLVLNRSKSVIPRHRAAPLVTEPAASPRKKTFWSFFALTYSSSSALIPYFSNKRRSTSSATSSFAAGSGRADPRKIAKEVEKTPGREQNDASAGNDDASPSGSQASSSFGRKVARSRSVGCGSRSFSGDFLERISNGFGDCALRRVESHRESKPKSSVQRSGLHGDDADDQQVEERAKCGGIFVGLGMVSSSAYWLSSTDACDESCRLQATTRRAKVPHSRSKSWAWTFASPMRVFRPPAAVATPPL